MQKMLTVMKKRVNGESGFTLIELLVVVIIIGILAAIAIPMYLSQREKGYIATAQSDLRNAAMAEESYFAGLGNGAYGATAVLAPEGYHQSNGITLTAVPDADGLGYCLTADHANLAVNYFYDSDVGSPGTAACT